MTTMTTILKSYEEAYGTATPVVKRMLGDYVDDLGADFVSKVIEVTAQAGGRTWPYLENPFGVQAQGHDLAAYEAEQIRRKGGRNMRVDRPTPSGTDWMIGKHVPLSERRMKRED